MNGSSISHLVDRTLRSFPVAERHQPVLEREGSPCVGRVGQCAGRADGQRPPLLAVMVQSDGVQPLALPRLWVKLGVGGLELE